MKIKRDIGQRVCWATSKDYPNYDGRARSRTLHLEHISKDHYAFPATQCGQRITEFVTENEFHILGRRICMQCISQRDRWRDLVVSEPSKI